MTYTLAASDSVVVRGSTTGLPSTPPLIPPCARDDAPYGGAPGVWFRLVDSPELGGDPHGRPQRVGVGGWEPCLSLHCCL